MLDFAFIRDNWLYIAMGLGATLGVTLVSLLIAIPLALLVAKGRRFSFLPFNALSTFYVYLADGVPLLVQIFFVFLALPQLGIILNGFWAAVSVLTVYYSARLSDVFYAHEASLGNIREADLRSLIPKIASEYVAMIKDTTLVTGTGFIHDVYWRAQQVGRAEFKNLEALVIAALIYLIVNTLISVSFGVRKFARAG
jgi:polar amino acid transport system permease protein